MHTRAIYPGTFDPVTNGHIDIIERGAKLFNRLVIAIAANPSKRPCFTLDERVTLVKAVISHLPNVEVISFDGLLVDCAAQQEASVLLRGLRTVTDLDYELQLANMNRRLSAKVESVFLTATENNACISSTFVKDIIFHGGNADQFVAPQVSRAFKDKISNNVI